MDLQKLDLETLDSATLYKIAQEKQQQEKEAQREHRQERIRELRALRKETLSRHKRELAEIERELELERGTVTRPRKESQTRRQARRRRDGEPTISEILLSTIGEKDSMPIEEIRERASAQGIKLSTVTQMLAYLKRTGRLKSLQRGNYSVAA